MNHFLRKISQFVSILVFSTSSTLATQPLSAVESLGIQYDTARILKATAICPPDTICPSRPSKFEFQYLGSECKDSSNAQEGKFTCGSESKNPAGSTLISQISRRGAHIRFTDKDGKVYFDTWVKTGERFRFNNKGYKFPSDMSVDIYTGSDLAFKLQSMKLHTSCSKNLYLGDVFGAVKLVGLYYIDVTENLLCDFKTEAPSSKPTLSPSNAPSPKPSLKPSLRRPSARPSAQPFPVPIVDGPNPPTNREPSNDTSCSPSLCLASPRVMTFAFLPSPGNCVSSSNSQDSKLFKCVDYALPNVDQFYVVFYKANNNNSKNKNKKDKKQKSNERKRRTTMTSVVKLLNDMDIEEVYFSDYVDRNGLIVIKANALGKSSNKEKIPANMSVIVYAVVRDANTTQQLSLVQSLTFHSSCSQNLFLTDSFGMIKLVGLEYKDGRVEKCNSF